MTPPHDSFTSRGGKIHRHSLKECPPDKAIESFTTLHSAIISLQISKQRFPSSLPRGQTYMSENCATASDRVPTEDAQVEWSTTTPADASRLARSATLEFQISDYYLSYQERQKRCVIASGLNARRDSLHEKASLNQILWLIFANRMV